MVVIILLPTTGSFASSVITGSSTTVSSTDSLDDKLSTGLVGGLVSAGGEVTGVVVGALAGLVFVFVFVGPGSTGCCSSIISSSIHCFIFVIVNNGEY